MSPLAFMKEGERARIIDLAGGHVAGSSGRWADHLANIGLRPGKEIEMVSNRGCGPLILQIDEMRIALGRGMAMRITIRRNEE